MVYHKTVNRDSDILTLFTGKFNDGTYLGTPIDMINDFNVGFTKQVAVENKMPNMLECIEAFEMINIDKELGQSQVLFEHSFSGKLDGFQRIAESHTVDWSNAMVTCYAAANLDAQNLATFVGRLTRIGGSDIFWENLDTWKAAHVDMKEARKAHHYGALGATAAHTLIDVTGGPISTGGPLPHIIPDILPVIHIPTDVVIAADLFAGLLYGITEQEGFDNLSECFYGFDEFVYDILHAYNWIASRTFVGLINGFILLMMTVMYIPNDVMTCVGAKGDIKPFEQWLATFKEPLALPALIEYNIKHHLAKLTIFVNKARKDLTEGNYALLGEDLGNMLAIATTPIPTNDSSAWFNFEVWSEM